jgi:ring-1,2-phenylacetyl-CoA epoxidase subunit PaaE
MHLRTAMTPAFHPLKIRDIRRETPDAVSIAFDLPDDLRSAYAFRPGQYLTLRSAFDGEEVRRSYSICSGLDDGELRVAIKRIAGGLYSAYANEDLRPGDTIEVMTPMGRFGLGEDTPAGRTVLCVAAGSGITPILSIVKALLAREVGTQVVLIYGNRTTGHIMFRRELEDLKDRYLGRFTVLHVLSREDHGSALLSGRIDGDKVETVVRGTLADAVVDDAYLCGPQAMTEAVRDRLVRLGVAPEHVHVELFTASAPANVKRRAAPAATPETVVPLGITLGGRRTQIDAHPGETVVEAGRRAGLDVPFSCTGGMCCTCRAKLVSGEAPMDVNYSLDPWEIAAGFVLTCQSRMGETPVEVDYDAM